MKQSIIDFLSERKSVRKFDSTVEIATKEIEGILTLAAKAPSGNNTQPWKVITVKNKELKKQIQALAFNQKQLETASAMFLVFGDSDAYDIEHQISYKKEAEQLSEERIQAFREKMESFYQLSPLDKGTEGLKLDCGLFAMNLLYAIRAYDYDAVPMRGADFEGIKKLLTIPSSWLPIVMIPFGKAVESGRYKIRKSVTDFNRMIE